MQLNGVVFPAPECSYSANNFPGELMFIPRLTMIRQGLKSEQATLKQRSQSSSDRKQVYSSKFQRQTLQDYYRQDEDQQQNINNSKIQSQRGSSISAAGLQESLYIPCLWLASLSCNSQLQNQSKNNLLESGFRFNDNHLQSTSQYNENKNQFEITQNNEKRRNSKIMLFFHGNAEDLGIAYNVLNQLKAHLKITILAVEYSGYGLFQGEKSADRVLTDCLAVYDYLTIQLGVAPSDIILFGRSIGSSPSCFIAKERPEVGCMILMSPFKSLREVAKDRVGKLLSYLLADRYRNIDLIEHTKCPVLIIHGMADTLIDVSHSFSLKAHCGSKICKLITPDNMNHNNFRFQEDLIIPFKEFFKENKIRLHHTQSQTKLLKIPVTLFSIPQSIIEQEKLTKQQDEECKQPIEPIKAKKQINLKGSTDQKLKLALLTEINKKERSIQNIKFAPTDHNISYLGLQSRNETCTKQMSRTHNSQYPMIKKDQIGDERRSSQMETFQIPQSLLKQDPNQFNVEGFESFLQEYEINLNKRKYQLQSSVRENTETMNSRQGKRENFVAIKKQSLQMESFLPQIKDHRYKVEEEQTDSKSIRQMNQKTPNKMLVEVPCSLQSFNLSPQSVKQSLPPGSSVDCGTNTQNSHARSIYSKISINKKKKKQMVLDEYNQYNSANDRKQNEKKNVGQNNQSQSYIDLLNERDLDDMPYKDDKMVKYESKELEGGVQVDDYYDDGDEAELLFGFMNPTVETVITNQMMSEVEIYKEDFLHTEMENKHESIQNSMEQKKKFEQLEHNVYHATNKSQITQNSQCESKAHHNSNIYTKGNEFHEMPMVRLKFNDYVQNNEDYAKTLTIMNRTQKHTQKNSRDFYMPISQRGCGQNNLFRQIREYKAARAGSQGRFKTNQFLSNISAKAMGQCTMQAGVQGIRDKKLASPMKNQKFKGDNNDDIPFQMTEEQQHHILSLNPINTLFSEGKRSGYSGQPPILAENQCKKALNISSIRKNQNSLNKLQSTLERKQQRLVQETIIFEGSSEKDNFNSVLNSNQNNMDQESLQQNTLVENDFIDFHFNDNINKQKHRRARRSSIKHQDADNEHTQQNMSPISRQMGVQQTRPITTQMATQTQTYQTTKIGGTLGFVTAIDTYTYADNENDPITCGPNQECVDQNLEPMGSTYQLQKEAMQKNTRLMKARKLNSIKGQSMGSTVQYQQSISQPVITEKKPKDALSTFAELIAPALPFHCRSKSHTQGSISKIKQNDFTDISKIGQNKTITNKIAKKRKTSWWGCFKVNN